VGAGRGPVVAGPAGLLSRGRRACCRGAGGPVVAGPVGLLSRGRWACWRGAGGPVVAGPVGLLSRGRWARCRGAGGPVVAGPVGLLAQAGGRVGAGPAGASAHRANGRVGREPVNSVCAGRRGRWHRAVGPSARSLRYAVGSGQCSARGARESPLTIRAIAQPSNSPAESNFTFAR
jgi:hypothetical protein